jgi:hypothetical protein
LGGVVRVIVFGWVTFVVLGNITSEKEQRKIIGMLVVVYDVSSTK